MDDCSEGINFNFEECKSYDVHKFNSRSLSKDKNFLIVSQNIRSFSKNIELFILFIDSLVLKPKIIVLTETWFSKNNFHNIRGFIGYHSFREERIGGGVSIFVNENFHSEALLNFNINCDFLEMCGVSVKISDKIVLNVLGFYRPPNGNLDLFFEKMTNLLENFPQIKTKNIKYIFV